MVELAAYAQCPTRLTIPGTMHIRMLLSTMLSVTKWNRDLVRTQLHKYLMRYTLSGLEADYGDCYDVLSHWQNLHQDVPRGPNRSDHTAKQNTEADRCIETIYKRVGCQAACASEKGYVKVTSTVSLTLFWERLVKGNIEQVSIPTVTEAIERKLYQQSGTAHMCGECAHKYQDEKVLIKLPTQLIVSMPGTRPDGWIPWRWPEQIQLGPTQKIKNTYMLVGLVIHRTGSHYTARVKLRGKWYSYDDLGGGNITLCDPQSSYDSDTRRQRIRAGVYIRDTSTHLYVSIKEYPDLDHSGSFDTVL